MTITHKQLFQFLRLIERDNACKVVGFTHDDDEALSKLEIFSDTPAFQQENFLGDFHFNNVDFVNKTISFFVFDDELEPLVRRFCTGTAEAPKVMLMN